ncbi:MAG TPA: penicillin-binding protein 1A, partial [Firmicutes bacterium]|nr:penicillin-binding protein 1A [Bacillota bacterium]
MLILNGIHWIGVKIIALVKFIVFIVLFAVLCATAFVNGFLSEVVADLPLIESLGVPDLAMTSKIYAADGTHLGDVFGEENRVLIGWHQIPQDLRDALVATEDKDFYEHPGFDIRGILRAFRENVASGNLTRQGGSTITQQLVRNLYLTPETTYKRKLAEIILAIKLEQKYSKDEILTFYLNQVYFGSNAYGVEAAAQTYFGHSASECNLAECALLAGLLQAPSLYSPYVDMERAKTRRSHVLQRMYDEGYITREEYEETNETEIVLAGRRNIGFSGLNHPYFSTYVIHEVHNILPYSRLYTDGLRIYTTVYPEWQTAAEEKLREGVASLSNYNVTQGALVSLDSRTGAIRAMVGGVDFDKSEFNRSWQALRQPGSSYKPYVYLAAMLEGYSPDSLVRDTPVEFRIPGAPVYRPRNYDFSYRGIITLRSALQISRNIPAVRIVDIIGAQKVASVARASGITSDIVPTLSMGIGASEVTLLEHTSAFATFANDGVRNVPYAIERITDARGTVIYQHKPNPQRVIAENPVRLLVSMMQSVVTGGTGTRARIPGHHIAGKTGTTDDWRDAWFLGFTPSISTGVWVGNDDNSKMNHITGGRGPAAIWHDFMAIVLKDMPDETFPPPVMPRIARAMDSSDSQAALEAEMALQKLADELGVDPEDYTQEQLRAMQERGD